MTFRSRSGGPIKQRKQKKQTHTRKLHHPPPPPQVEEDKPTIPNELIALPPSIESGPFNPPDSEILALLNRALHYTLSSDDFIENIQKIKGLLYDKKWLDVFCGDEYILESYAGRWVPPRACCFREVMDKLVGGVFTGVDGVENGLEGEMEGLGVDDEEEGEDDEEEEEEEDEDEDEEEGEEVEEEQEQDEEEEHQDTTANPTTEASSLQAQSPQPQHHILSLGGGAGSELLAITALIRSVILTRPHSHPIFTWTGIDIGNWHNVLKKIEDSVKVDWKIDKDLLDVEYIKGDLLNLTSPSSTSTSTTSTSSTTTSSENSSKSLNSINLTQILHSKPPSLITLSFTLTELLTQSRPKTLSLLTTLTENCAIGTKFLIIDSASDISDFTLGSSGRKYPVFMIIDMLLCSKGRGWRKVKSEDSRWFRFQDGVGDGWKVKLENTRYWYRLYERV